VVGADALQALAHVHQALRGADLGGGGGGLGALGWVRWMRWRPGSSRAPSLPERSTPTTIKPTPPITHQEQQRGLLVVVGAQVAQDGRQARVVAARAHQAQRHHSVLGDLRAVAITVTVGVEVREW